MTNLNEAERDKYSMINFEETELRLGLPRASAPANETESSLKNTWCAGGKRGFSDATVDLRLNLSSGTTQLAHDRADNSSAASPSNDPAKPPAKAQIVGWPPVRSSRKSMGSVQKNSNSKKEKEKEEGIRLVKVSMDGAPYLRKVDLKGYQSYQQLWDAVDTMFIITNNGHGHGHGCPNPDPNLANTKDDTKLIDLLNASDYVPTYQDKDGDWMLVGDVPWQMFVESCTRLRIMKGSDAIGLAPRAVEKCKSRS